MTPDRQIRTVGMTIRRSGARLRAMSKTHSPLHVLLWQAKEAEKALQVAASAQNTLFTDVASWASTENVAISDICSNFAELSALAASAEVQLARAYKSFRKDMTMVLEGEKRADAATRKLKDAETKRHKARRLVLQAQNRTQVTGMPSPTTPDYLQLKTQLAEAEKQAERAHLFSCETKSEAEAVKLIMLRSSLSKLSKGHVGYAQLIQTIFNGGQQLATHVPHPPPPGELLSRITYNGFELSRSVVGDVKSQVQVLSTSSSPLSTAPTFLPTPPRSTSTSTTNMGTATTPNWATPSSSAPENPFLSVDIGMPPPPYNRSPSQNEGWTQQELLNSNGGPGFQRNRYSNGSFHYPGQSSTPLQSPNGTGRY